MSWTTNPWARSLGADNVAPYRGANKVTAALEAASRAHTPEGAHQAALARLRAARADLPPGGTPCTRPGADPSDWVAEASDPRTARAEDACLDCPVFFPCGEAGRWEFGVWGGQHRTHEQAQKARQAA